MLTEPWCGRPSDLHNVEIRDRYDFDSENLPKAKVGLDNYAPHRRNSVGNEMLTPFPNFGESGGLNT